MGYYKRVLRARSFLIIRKSHNINMPPPDKKRIRRGEGSSDKVKLNNERYAEQHLEALVDLNFKIGDFWIDLHYSKDDRPMEYEEAEERLTKFIRKLRAEWKKVGGEFKYIATTECGKTGGYHHHILLNAGTVSAERVMMMWGMRYCSNKLVYSEDLSQLADYIFKQSTIEAREERGHERKKRWRSSKNLIKPEVEKKIIKAKTWAAIPAPPKGYILDKNSVMHGQDWLGYPWMEYKLIKITPPHRARRKE
jgi:hypothetical protein